MKTAASTEVVAVVGGWRRSSLLLLRMWCSLEEAGVVKESEVAVEEDGVVGGCFGGNED